MVLIPLILRIVIPEKRTTPTREVIHVTRGWVANIPTIEAITKPIDAIITRLPSEERSRLVSKPMRHIAPNITAVIPNAAMMEKAS